MKHKWNNIRDHMQKVYTDMDSFALLRIAFYEVVRLNKTFQSNFVNFNNMSP